MEDRRMNDGRRRQLPNMEAGQSMVEFALILPILLLMVLGVVDFGRAFFTYEALANAAREGARYCALNAPATIGTQNRVQNELEGSVPGLVIATTTCATDPGSGQPVTVKAAATFSPITPRIGSLFSGTSGADCPSKAATDLCLSASAQMMRPNY